MSLKAAALAALTIAGFAFLFPAGETVAEAGPMGAAMAPTITVARGACFDIEITTVCELDEHGSPVCWNEGCTSGQQYEDCKIYNVNTCINVACDDAVGIGNCR